MCEVLQVCPLRTAMFTCTKKRASAQDSDHNRNPFFPYHGLLLRSKGGQSDQKLSSMPSSFLLVVSRLVLPNNSYFCL